MSRRRVDGFRTPDQLLLPWSPRYSISARRAAEMLDVSIDSVCRLIDDGELKAYKVRNKKNSPWRVNYDSVIEYLERIHQVNGLERRF